MEIKNHTIKKSDIIKSIIFLLVLIILVYVVYQIATWKKQCYIGNENLKIPVFLYHDIVEKKSDIKYDYMQTDKETFEKQIRGLKKFGYTVITYEQLVNYKNGVSSIPKHSCLIDFDDGYEGNYKFALNIIKKYNVPVNIYVINDCIGKDGYLNWDEIKQLDETKLVTINTHGKEHYDFTKEDPNKAVEDVKYAHGQIEKNLGKNQIRVFTYPYGLYNDEIVEKLKDEGFYQNLTDNKINKSNSLDLSKIHRCYCLEDSIFKMMLKVKYRSIRYQ